MTNKVIDYLTMDETCDIIGISRNSKAQLVRWINDGRIQGAYKFGNSWAIPVNWVKSECMERGIKWNGVELREGEKGVSLDDYIQLSEYAKNKDINIGTMHGRITRGAYKDDYIRFGSTFGLPKK